MNKVEELENRGLISPPKWLGNNISYLTLTGSVSYGVSSDDSDIDYVGFCVPPKLDIFPHLDGEIIGFGKPRKSFQQWQKHAIEDKSNSKIYDINVYGIVKFFQLCIDNNPNMIDVLFTPTRCINLQTIVGQMVRENRKLFLHKGCWQKFKGYAYSQLTKMSKKEAKSLKRMKSIKEYGYDTKFGYNLVRLLLEVEQILTEGDLDLTRGREQLKAIRNGEWTEDRVRNFFSDKEKQLEIIYNECEILPYTAPIDGIKNLLINCLEEHYGSLSKVVVTKNKADKTINEIIRILEGGGYV